MKVRLLTLFPEMCRSLLRESLLKRAAEAGVLEAECVDIRDFTEDRHRTADASPYGGGAGMVMMAEPIHKAMVAIERKEGGVGRVVMPTPRGRRFDDAAAQTLAREACVTFICGHYEGIDERVSQRWVQDEFSIGDYVLTGGELPALVMLDAISRYVPGVVGNPASVEQESFAQGVLEYPQFTRPAELDGLRVPDILLSGNHEAIRTWRRQEALRVTATRRPELLEKAALTEREASWLKEQGLPIPNRTYRERGSEALQALGPSGNQGSGSLGRAHHLNEASL